MKLTINDLKQFKNLIILYAIIIIFTISASIFFTNSYKEDISQNYESVLTTILNITNNSIENWVEKELSLIKDFSTSEIVKTNSLILIDTSSTEIEKSEALAALREYYVKYYSNEFNGFFIIDSHYMNVGSMRKYNLYQKNIIALQQPKLIENSFRGFQSFIPSVKSDLKKKYEIESDFVPLTMFVSSPIYDGQKVIAVATLRLRPLERFTLITKNGRIGETGETYIFDNQANMISQSRFPEQVLKLGLLEKQNSQNLRVFDYKKIDQINSPTDLENNTEIYTEMAKTAISGFDGKNLTGYGDYRGIDVIGIWKWNKKYQIGIASEITYNEAFSKYNDNVLIFIIFNLFVIIGSIFIIVQNIKYRKSKQQILQNTIENEQEQNKFLSSIISNLSHEINTPLTSINSYLDTIIAYIDKMDKEKLLELLTTVLKSTSKIKEISSRIDLLLKIKSNIPDFNSVNLSKLVEDVTKTIPNSDEIFNYDFNFDIDINTDYELLKYAVKEIINNNIKHKKSKVKIKTFESGNNYILEFINDGGHINEADLLNLYAPFYKSKDSLAIDEGLGIGLSVVKTVSDKINAKVSIENIEENSVKYSLIFETS